MRFPTECAVAGQACWGCLNRRFRKTSTPATVCWHTDGGIGRYPVCGQCAAAWSRWHGPGHLHPPGPGKAVA